MQEIALTEVIFIFRSLLAVAAQSVASVIVVYFVVFFFFRPVSTSLFETVYGLHFAGIALTLCFTTSIKFIVFMVLGDVDGLFGRGEVGGVEALITIATPLTVAYLYFLIVQRFQEF